MTDAKARVATPLSKSILEDIHRGIKKYRYKGLPTHKCPFDLVLYTELLWDLKPKTIIEIGSGSGGSALWIADTLTTFGMTDTKLYSYDRSPVCSIKDARITFGMIDTGNPKAYITSNFLRAIKHPLLFIDDASHQYEDVLRMLNFFNKWFQPGDYVIVEDGIVSALQRDEEFGGGPLRAIHEFLARNRGRYEIDRDRCDRYGAGVTWNPDGYIWCLGQPTALTKPESKRKKRI